MQDHAKATTDDPQDPALLAQRLFEGYEEQGADDAPPPAVEVALGAVVPADRDELLLVIRNLEAVTASLIATSEALASIALSLTE